MNEKETIIIDLVTRIDEDGNLIMDDVNHCIKIIEEYINENYNKMALNHLKKIQENIKLINDILLYIQSLNNTDGFYHNLIQILLQAIQQRLGTLREINNKNV